MNKMEIESIDENGDIVTDFATYDPAREEQNKINAKMAELPFNVEFIQYYIHIKREYGLTDLQTLIYGFVRHFTYNGKIFWVGNDKLGKMFGVHPNSASRAVSDLVQKGLIRSSHKTTPNDPIRKLSVILNTEGGGHQRAEGVNATVGGVNATVEGGKRYGRGGVNATVDQYISSYENLIYNKDSHKSTCALESEGSRDGDGGSLPAERGLTGSDWMVGSVDGVGSAGGTGTGGKKKNSAKRKSDDLERFNAFWAGFPNKKAKGAALKAWCKLTVDEQNECIRVLPVHCLQDQWTRDGGKFIPHPATWLNQRRWEDEQRLPTDEELIEECDRIGCPKFHKKYGDEVWNRLFPIN